LPLFLPSTGFPSSPASDRPPVSTHCSSPPRRRRLFPCQRPFTVIPPDLTSSVSLRQHHHRPWFATSLTPSKAGHLPLLLLSRASICQAVSPFSGFFAHRRTDPLPPIRCPFFLRANQQASFLLQAQCPLCPEPCLDSHLVAPACLIGAVCLLLTGGGFLIETNRDLLHGGFSEAARRLQGHTRRCSSGCATSFFFFFLFFFFFFFFFFIHGFLYLRMFWSFLCSETSFLYGNKKSFSTIDLFPFSHVTWAPLQ